MLLIPMKVRLAQGAPYAPSEFLRNSSHGQEKPATDEEILVIDDAKILGQEHPLGPFILGNLVDVVRRGVMKIRKSLVRSTTFRTGEDVCHGHSPCAKYSSVSGVGRL